MKTSKLCVFCFLCVVTKIQKKNKSHSYKLFEVYKKKIINQLRYNEWIGLGLTLLEFPFRRLLNKCCMCNGTCEYSFMCLWSHDSFRLFTWHIACLCPLILLLLMTIYIQLLLFSSICIYCVLIFPPYRNQRSQSKHLNPAIYQKEITNTTITYELQNKLNTP